MSDDISFPNPRNFSYRHYTLQWVLGCITTSERQAVVDFWLSEGALTDPQAALQRTNQVVYIARNSQNDIVGICTVYLSKLNQSANPYFFYRSFIRKGDRAGLMSVAMLKHTCKHLQNAYQTHKTASPGIIVIAENSKLTRTGAQRMWTKLGFTLIGHNHKHQSTYLYLFSKQPNHSPSLP